MLHCVIWEEMAVFYQIIYQQKSNLIPFNFYLTGYREKEFENYYNWLTELITVENIELTNAENLLYNFSTS